jgi:hypothetical protein
MILKHGVCRIYGLAGGGPLRYVDECGGRRLIAANDWDSVQRPIDPFGNKDENIVYEDDRKTID